MNKIKKTGMRRYILTNIIAALSFIIFIYICINYNSIPQGHRAIIIFPFIWGAYNLFGSIRKWIFRAPSLALFDLLCFIRYGVLIFLLVLNNNYSSARFSVHVNSDEDYLFAYELMLYELIVIIITIELCIKLMFKSNISVYKQNIPINKGSCPGYLLVVLLGIAGLFLFPKYLDNMNIFSVKSGFEKEVIQGSFLSLTLGYFIKSIQIVIFLSLLKYYARRQSRYKHVNKWPLFFFAFLNCAIIWNTNRTTLLINVILTLIMLIYIFPEYKKEMTFLFGGAGIIMVILMTLYRSFGIVSVAKVGTSGFTSIYGLNVFSSYLGEYVSGPDSVLSGIQIKNLYPVNFDTFMNDMFMSTNVISKFLSPSFVHNNTAYFFNQYCGFHVTNSVIIPSVSEGYLFFGFLGAPIFTVITLIIMMFSEKKALTSRDIGLKYAWNYNALFISGIPGANWMLSMMYLSMYFLPLYLIMKFNVILYKTKKRSISKYKCYNE